jgi:hypothetical protein
VADLNDEDKVLAVLPGGVSGRLFHPHTKDQVKAYMSGEKVYWWFSDKAIKEHTRTRLDLTPPTPSKTLDNLNRLSYASEQTFPSTYAESAN